MMYGLNLDCYESYDCIEFDEIDVITDQKYSQKLMENNKLTPIEGAFMYQASLYLKEPENYIFFEYGVPSIIDLCREFNIKKTKLYEVLKSLEKKDYIRIVNDESNRKFIYINPSLHFKRGIAINTYKLFKSQSIEKIIPINSLTAKIKNKESFLQNYLKDNLHLIEDGMSFLETEYLVADGRVDILAIDKNNKKCVIELKVINNDEKLVFQSVYYPTQFKEPVRMITIAPDYANKIYESLKSLKYVEMKQYLVSDNELKIINYKKDDE